MTCQCKCQCRTQEAVDPVRSPFSRGPLLLGATLIGLVAWGVLYSCLQPLSEGMVSLLPLGQEDPFRKALAFFLYDAPKVFMLLGLVVFLMGIVRSFFSPEKTRKFLTGKGEGIGNIIAACLGIVTPFCSCSAVPLFVGFVSAGVPLGVTFSFLISAPMVNEIALGLLFGLVGWKIALAYLGFGLGVAIVAGWIMGRLHLESGLEEWVRSARSENVIPSSVLPTKGERIKEGLRAVREIVGKIWLWIIAGIAIGAFIHGYVPEALLMSALGENSWWSVPAAVLIGVPLYANAAGVIPIVEALLGKGVALGTVLAFMMSVTALSFPEAVILRRVLSLRLLCVYFGVVTGGILAVGYLFKALM